MASPSSAPAATRLAREPETNIVLFSVADAPNFLHTQTMDCIQRWIKTSHKKGIVDADAFERLIANPLVDFFDAQE